MLFDGIGHQVPDTDPGETEEWLDSFDAIVDARGRARARYLLMKLLERARTKQVEFPATVSTPYVNTIPADAEPWFPGDEYQERRIRAYIRWNAAAMVVRANTRTEGIGGHLSTYASSAALYEVGFNHFFRGKADGGFGDQVYFQGHASPGIYARAFVEGRLTEKELDNFRHEVGGDGLPSYPHPRSLPDFWEFPTVSMGLGPIAAVYQAHVNRYLNARRLVDTSGSRVWCFVGDGEMDEPESIGALGVAGREHLDNLIFVVNCNLQRLDGPVRGNGKIIQELEAVFRGAGWNVIKVIWGSRWDALLAKDVDGVLLDRMNTTVDGEYQKLAVESGAYIREHFFGPDPRLRKMVEDLSDDELRSLPRGGHDYRKLYAAYKLATEQKGSPTVILAKTIKGWTLGPEIEARNATHQIKKMTKSQVRVLRDRLYMTEDIPDSALEGDPPYVRPAVGSDAMEYLRARGRVLDGPLPVRVVRPTPALRPDAKVFEEFAAGSGQQSVSTTMVFARLLRNLVRDPTVGWPVAPIVSDEARTFGLEPLIAEAKIYAPEGQHYIPVDADLPLNYAESASGTCSRKASARPVRSQLSFRCRPPTPRGASRWCRCSCSIPCSASSGSATWPGPWATCAAGASWPAAPPGAPPSWARACSTTTGSPPSWLHQPGRPRLRRLVRLRGGRDHGGGGGGHARCLTPGPLLVPRSTTRPIPCRLSPRATKARPCGGASSTASTCSRLPPRSRATCGRHCASRDRCGASRWMHNGSWPSTASPPTSLPSPRGATCAPTRSRSNGGTACTPRQSRAPQSSPRHWATGPIPSWPSPTTCAACPTRWRVSWTALTRRSGPTASGAPTPATRCGRTSRSTAPTWLSPCCSSSPRAEGSPDRWSPRRSPTWASTPPVRTPFIV